MPPRHAQEQKVKVTWASQFLATARVSVTAVRENVPVLLMTGIAFGGSYGHIAELCGKYGPHGWVQYATAGCVDLLCVIGAEERQRDKRIGRARNGKKVTWPTVILFIGILVTLAANAATANRSFLGYCVAAWPAAALLLAVSILERRASYEIPLQIAESELQAELETERATRLRLEEDLAADRERADAEADALRRQAADAAEREATLAAEVERLKADAESAKGDTPRPTPRRRQGDTRTDASVAPARRRDAVEDPLSAAAEIVTLEQARAILEAEPDISGSDLGRRLGFKPSYGRTLKQKLTKVSPGGGQ